MGLRSVQLGTTVLYIPNYFKQEETLTPFAIRNVPVNGPIINIFAIASAPCLAKDWNCGVSKMEAMFFWQDVQIYLTTEPHLLEDLNVIMQLYKRYYY